MTLQEAIEYIEAHTWSQWKLGLSRTRNLLALLGDPQKQLRFVHVAGSNGKGSTCAMLERILREAGYVTGLYPSPFIEDFRERIQVCGEYISEEALCRITERVRELADSMEDHPTQFELITAIGMVYFAEKKCDIVVLEVGLGGTFDSTNIIDAPEVAVITNIGLEHTEYLGNTLAEIAANKCGIIKSGADVVCYENVPEVMDVVRSVCGQKGCPLHIARFGRIDPVERSLYGQTFRFLKNVPQEAAGTQGAGGVAPGGDPGNMKDTGVLLRLALLGEYQLHNAAVALTTVEALRSRGFEISEGAVIKGLAEVKWPARFEVLSYRPLFILDGGHNPQCAAALAESLRTYLPNEKEKTGENTKVVFLMGMLADKDYRTVIDLISPFAAAFVCLTPDSPRALPAEDLAEELRRRGFSAEARGTAGEGIEAALALAGLLAETPDAAGDKIAEARTAAGQGCAAGTAALPVVAFGSLYMAGEVRGAFRALQKERIAALKKSQRRAAMSRRRSLSEAEREEKSRAICRLLGELPQLRNAETVFSYAAAPDEVNTDEINHILETMGKRVCYPVCEKDGIMKAVIPAAGDPDAWRIGAYGIREPVMEKSVAVSPEEIDAVIVPCVVFDRKGGRCGHGAGYYDRYLVKVSPDVPKILVAFDVQETEEAAGEETDVPMDLIVTESGVPEFS